MSRFSERIRPFVQTELTNARAAEQSGDVQRAFVHLERAHVLGQASTREHIRMLHWALRRGDAREVAGQAVHIVGAATKTALGLVPHSNTGGANVSPFRRMPIAPDLAKVLREARHGLP